MRKIYGIDERKMVTMGFLRWLWFKMRNFYKSDRRICEENIGKTFVCKGSLHLLSYRPIEVNGNMRKAEVSIDDQECIIDNDPCFVASNIISHAYKVIK